MAGRDCHGLLGQFCFSETGLLELSRLKVPGLCMGLGCLSWAPANPITGRSIGDRAVVFLVLAVMARKQLGNR